MRVLLDECVPRALRAELPGHEVATVAEAGWAGIKNGALLQLAATRFEVLLTVDRNLEYQQKFTGLAIAVIVVHVLSNDIDAIRADYAQSSRSVAQRQAGNSDACPRLTAQFAPLARAGRHAWARRYRIG